MAEPNLTLKIKETSERFTIEDVIVVTDISRTGSGRYCTRLCRDCNKFEEEVFLEFSSQERYNCKDLISLMFGIAEAECMSRKTNIIVEPNSKEARTLALMLYASLTDKEWDLQYRESG